MIVLLAFDFQQPAVTTTATVIMTPGDAARL